MGNNYFNRDDRDLKFVLFEYLDMDSLLSYADYQDFFLDWVRVRVTYEDPPTISLPGGALNYTENDGAVVIDSGATVTDPDKADTIRKSISRSTVKARPCIFPCGCLQSSYQKSRHCSLTPWPECCVLFFFLSILY